MKDCYGESLRNFGNETMKKLTDSTTKFATLFTDLTTAVGSRKVIDDLINLFLLYENKLSLYLLVVVVIKAIGLVTVQAICSCRSE